MQVWGMGRVYEKMEISFHPHRIRQDGELPFRFIAGTKALPKIRGHGGGAPIYLNRAEGGFRFLCCCRRRTDVWDVNNRARVLVSCPSYTV